MIGSIDASDPNNHLYDKKRGGFKVYIKNTSNNKYEEKFQDYETQDDAQYGSSVEMSSSGTSVAAIAGNATNPYIKIFRETNGTWNLASTIYLNYKFDLVSSYSQTIYKDFDPSTMNNDMPLVAYLKKLSFSDDGEILFFQDLSEAQKTITSHVIIQGYYSKYNSIYRIVDLKEDTEGSLITNCSLDSSEDGNQIVVGLPKIKKELSFAEKGRIPYL